MDDAHFMRIAIEESKKGNWPYGAVITLDDELIVQGHNTSTQDKDCTARRLSS